MERISIVILNYLNYKDTVECIESIYNMQYEIAGIVIVDNHSDNKSFNILNKLYKKNNDIILIRTKQNYGFAKGNNIGIKIARQKFHSDFVFVVNNDVIFQQKNFFETLLSQYEQGVGILGPEIRLKGNKVQDKFSVYVTLKDNIILYTRNFLSYKNKEVWVKVLPNLDVTKREVVLHGCALLFTPDFFQHYQGFYHRTFLYNEEGILYLMCKRHDLRQKYVKEAFLYHKEDQSSELSFQNDNKIINYYHITSHKYLIWWILKIRVLELIHRVVKFHD